MRFTPKRQDQLDVGADLGERKKWKADPRGEIQKMDDRMGNQSPWGLNERPKWKGHTVGADELAAGDHRWDGEMGDGGSFYGNPYHYGYGPSGKPTAPGPGANRGPKRRRNENK